MQKKKEIQYESTSYTLSWTMVWCLKHTLQRQEDCIWIPLDKGGNWTWVFTVRCNWFVLCIKQRRLLLLIVERKKAAEHFHSVFIDCEGSRPKEKSRETLASQVYIGYQTSSALPRLRCYWMCAWGGWNDENWALDTSRISQQPSGSVQHSRFRLQHLHSSWVPFWTWPWTPKLRAHSNGIQWLKCLILWYWWVSEIKFQDQCLKVKQIILEGSIFWVSFWC